MKKFEDIQELTRELESQNYARSFFFMLGILAHREHEEWAELVVNAWNTDLIDYKHGELHLVKDSPIVVSTAALKELVGMFPLLEEEEDDMDTKEPME